MLVIEREVNVVQIKEVKNGTHATRGRGVIFLGGSGGCSPSSPREAGAGAADPIEPLSAHE